MSGGTEGEDATPDATTGGSRAEGGQEFSVKEADYSEGGVKLKIGLGTKRTKKPPKILENYVCRPHIRTSLRPGRGSGSGSQGGRGGPRNEVSGANKSHSPMRNKDSKDVMISEPTSSLASTALSCPSSSANAGDKSATAAEAPVSLPAKRAPPKLAHKAGMKENVSEGATKINQNGNKLSGAGKTDDSPPSSSLSPTPAASPPSPTKQHSAVQEGAKVTNGDTQREEKRIGPSQGISSAGPEKLRKRSATSTSTTTTTIGRLKQQRSRACKPPPLSDSHVSSVGNSAASSSSSHTPCYSTTLSDTSLAPAAHSHTHTDNDQGKLSPPSQGKSGAVEREREGDKAEETNKSISLSATNTGTSSSVTTANSNKSSTGKGQPQALSPKAPINSDQSHGEVPAGQRDTASSSLTNLASVYTASLGSRPVPWKGNNNTGGGNPKDLSVNKPTVASEQMKVDSVGTKGVSSGQNRRSGVPLQQDAVPPVSPPPPSPPPPAPPPPEHFLPEQDSRPLKKRRGRCPRWTRTLHQAQMPDRSACLVSNSAASQQAAKSAVPPRRPVGRPPKSSQFAVVQPKKRGRPRLNLSKPAASKGPDKNNTTLACTAVDTEDEEEEEEERDTLVTSSAMNVTPPTILKRKRGRPKLLSPSVSSELGASSGDALKGSPEALEGSGQSCSKGSGQLIMKSIIGKINKMRTKRRKWVLNQLLSGQGGDERAKKTGGLCGFDPSPGGAVPALTASFGGKLGPQINVSKKGTIYIGKRRGRKPKVPNGDSKLGFSKDYSPSLSAFGSRSQSAGANGLFSGPSSKNQSAIALNQSKAFFSHTPSSAGASLFQSTSSFLVPSQKKALSYREQHQLRHDRKTSLSSSPLSASSLNELKDPTLSPLSETLPSDSSIGTDNGLSDWVERAATGGRDVGGLSMGRGYASRTSDALCPRWTFGVIPYRGHENSGATTTGLGQYSRTQPSRSPPPPPPLAEDQWEKHKHKSSKGRVHSCSSYKLKEQKHRCKRKHQQRKTSRQDPDFLLEVEKLSMRLSNIHLLHQRSVPEAVLDGEGSGGGGGGGGGSGAGGSSLGASRHTHPHHCIPQNLLPTIFQINFSGYYSPHLACPYDSLHYVRKKTDLKKKHSTHTPQYREVSPPDVSLLQGLGFPVSQTGFYRTPHRIPYGSPVGLSYYKRYPSSEGLYAQPEHSASFSSHPTYTHPHHSYPVYRHSSKLHKKKHKLLRQDCGGDGVRSPGMYPGLSASDSACFWTGECKRKHRHRHGEHSLEERGGAEWDVAGADKADTRNLAEGMRCPWRHRYGSSANRGFVPPPHTPATVPPFSTPSASESCVFKEDALGCMGSSKPFQTASGGRGGFLHKPWLRDGGIPKSSSAPAQAEEKAGDSSLDSESEEDSELTSSARVPSRPHHVNLFTNAFSQGPSARFGSLSAGSRDGISGGVSELGVTNRRDRYTHSSKSRDTGREASPDSGTAELLENGVHLQSGIQHQRGSLPHRHAQGLCSLPGQSSLAASPASRGLRGSQLASFTQGETSAGFSGALSEPSHSSSSYRSRVQGPQYGSMSKRTNLNHLNKILRAKKMQRQAVTGNNVVKKRGPGRPRKYPLPSGSPPPSTTSSSLDLLAKDSIRGGLETGGQGPVKRGKKRKYYDQGGVEVEEQQEQDRRMQGGGRGGGGKNEFPLVEHLSIHSLESGKPKSQTSTGSGPSHQAQHKQSASLREYGIPQPPKKKYERAGLYSDVYKTDDPEAQLRQLHWDTLEYIPGERDYSLLPAPIHVGKYLRLKRIDFQLPYDIQWFWKHNQLHRKPDPPAYRKITSNVFVDVKPISEHIATQCSCSPPEDSTAKGCVDGSCINRRMFVECTPGECPCGEQCANQVLQKRQGIRGLERCRAIGTGWSLRTPQPLRPGQFITEYLGEVISQQEFRRRMMARRYGPSPQYSLTLTGGTVIDSHRMGSEARFIQHSVEPSCQVQKWSVNGICRLGVFALRHIDSGEELTLNYNTHHTESQVCKYSMDESESPSLEQVQQVLLTHQQPREEGGDTHLLKSADTDTHTHTGRKQESTVSSSRCSPGLRMKALSSRDREFVLTRGIFLVRNYEAVRQKQEQLWRPDEGDQRNERHNWTKDCHDVSACVSAGSQKTTQEAEVSETENLTQICKEICDIMTRYKDSAGHILAAPLLNLRSRKRRQRGSEGELEPLDLSTVRRQIVMGQYQSLEAFDKDMLRVFLSAEKYYGKKSAVGRDVCRLRRAYHSIRRNAAIQLGNTETGGPSKTAIPRMHDRNPDRQNGHHDEQRANDGEAVVQCEQPSCGVSGEQVGEVCFPSSLILHSALDRMEAQRKRLDMVVWKLLQRQSNTEKRPSITSPPSRLQPSSTHQAPSSPCEADRKNTRAEAKRTEG